MTIKGNQQSILFQTEIKAEICSKDLIRAFGKVLFIDANWHYLHRYHWSKPIIM